MKIAVISDLHGYLPIYPSKYWDGIEDCEILLICGDILPLSIQTNMPKSKDWLIVDFKLWASDLPVEKVYIIAGNHDFWFERNSLEAHSIFSKYDKVTYLCNEFADYISTQDSKVHRIFGTPYCKIFGNWAFMRNNEFLAQKYNEIPENVDIFISHDAPKVSDVGMIKEGNWSGKDAGNPVLAKYILEKKPKYAFCGHIHSGNHELQEIEGIKFANTSIVNERYDLFYKPLIVRI